MIHIENRRECFFDDYLIDRSATTAQFLLHQPISGEVILHHDASWEGDGCTYHNFFYDNGIYRMYYVARNTVTNESMKRDARQCEEKYMRICYAESRDGLNWEKPVLNLCFWQGSTENNIILDWKTAILDNFFVFRDDNPNCPPEERYKAILQLDKQLYAFFSGDGIRFRKGRLITGNGTFDTLNVFFWDEAAQVYRGYFRSFHHPQINEADYESPRQWPAGMWGQGVRDIRYIESKDFVNWTAPVQLDFMGKPDTPLYTNCVSLYDRAPHMYVGFPTRYIARQEWTKSFDVLCGVENRKKRMEIQPRFGLAVTDCLFMCSRDGIHFTRYDEAFIRPGPEFDKNWVYGSCYLARGLLETPSHMEGAETELSLFAKENQWFDCGAVLRRYRLRKDGFVSLHAGAEEATITTKPFVFKGSKLYANMSTSAFGYLYISIQRLGDGKVIHSCEMFGDSSQKEIGFDEDLSQYAGESVIMTARLRDGDLYAIQFAESQKNGSVAKYEKQQ